MSLSSKVEVEFFNNGQVVVTNARFVFNGSVYAISKIKSLTAAYEPKGLESFEKKSAIVFLIFFSVLILTVVIFNNSFDDSNGLIVTLLLAMTIPAYLYIRPHVPKHTILVHFSPLDIVSIKSADQKYLEDVFTALNSAIAYRG